MSFYWSVGSLPELQDLPRRERMRIWRRLPSDVFWKLVLLQCLVQLPLFIGAIELAILPLFDQALLQISKSHRQWIIVMLTIMTFAACTIAWHFQLKSIRPILHELREQECDD